jgi:anaerobic ribonucleoside-triphosphate reductase
MNEGVQSCRCCGESTLSESHSYEICEICGWEDDPVQNEDASFRGGANQMSLNEARAYWNATRKRVDCANGSAEMNAIQKQAQVASGLQQ